MIIDFVSKSENFTVITPDLRGYGNSMAPASDDRHQTYSKRSMAEDMIHLMDFFSIDKFIFYFFKTHILFNFPFISYFEN